jgi:hypothetical protein
MKRRYGGLVAAEPRFDRWSIRPACMSVQLADQRLALPTDAVERVCVPHPKSVAPDADAICSGWGEAELRRE